MCNFHGTSQLQTTRTADDSTLLDDSRRPAFRATKLTATTFAILEHSDIYSERPLIYTKVVRPARTILILDTGCGGATSDHTINLRSLRRFIETVPVPKNEDGRPLNEGGKMGYVVVLSHCHFDHILGVEQFAKDSPILASAYDPSFLSHDNLPTHSLCKDLKITTPHYTPILVPHLHQIQSHYSTSASSKDMVSAHPSSLGPIVLHTPGHTPDEIALWDEAEQLLYVGDTLYEWAPIIFPTEGSIVKWLTSVDELILLVAPYPGARIACGHVTAGRPAMEVLNAAEAFIQDVVSGMEPVRDRFEKRGETCVQYVQEGMRYSLVCPERLVEEAKRVLSATQ